MPRTAKIIKIPKPPPGSFDRNRAAGTLLRSQAIHLRHALSKYVHEVTAHLHQATELLAINPGSIKTEGEASDYSKRVMALLHPQAARRPRS